MYGLFVCLPIYASVSATRMRLWTMFDWDVARICRVAGVGGTNCCSTSCCGCTFCLVGVDGIWWDQLFLLLAAGVGGSNFCFLLWLALAGPAFTYCCGWFYLLLGWCWQDQLLLLVVVCVGLTKGWRERLVLEQDIDVPETQWAQWFKVFKVPVTAWTFDDSNVVLTFRTICR